ncbi:MAG: sugar transferase [Verrucomicrobia bacterium]|nr:sugar transferase [Verrucomicrobiota bacterium]MCH8510723.1 sugar transferase [Kiritimatiellia bacterium]
MNWSHHPTKRFLDAGFACSLLLIFSPIFLVLMLVVGIGLGRPLFFRQPRPGKDGEIFELIKFRTMRTGEGTDAERMTRLGRFLRHSGLDELPELWNILKGDMSFVGPRPLLVEYLPRYDANQARRHEVRPGLTGWAQIHGRNRLSWSEKFQMDVWYVDHASFWLDLKILFFTFSQLRSGGDPAEPFSGNPS